MTRNSFSAINDADLLAIHAHTYRTFCRLMADRTPTFSNAVELESCEPFLLRVDDELQSRGIPAPWTSRKAA